MEVTVIETGLANIASVRAAFERLGCVVQLTRSAESVLDAGAVVLPGVGSFGAGMKSLVEQDLVEAIRTRVVENQPTLAICLGLQLLASASEESDGVDGIGAFESLVQGFPSTVRTPQFGWNKIRNENAPVLGGGGFVYYANSYRLTSCPSGWQSGWTDYGGPFVGCLQRGQVVACQFHPELSGAYGAEILSRWLQLEGGERC